MKTIKALLLVLIYLPAIMRTMFKVERGGYFAFRNESNSFLKFVWASSGNSPTLQDWHNQCIQEIEMRIRRGDW